MNAVKTSTPNGTAMVESASIRPQTVLSMPRLQVDRVEAHRHDDPGDHLRDQQGEGDDRAAARPQFGQRVPRRRGERQGQRDGAQAHEQAGAEVGQLLADHRR